MNVQTRGQSLSLFLFLFFLPMRGCRRARGRELEGGRLREERGGGGWEGVSQYGPAADILELFRRVGIGGGS